MRLASRVLLAPVLALSSCDRIEGERPDPVATEGTGSTLGGVARIDITPVPGFAMGGHALEADVSLGIWTHLYANVVYVEDGRGTPLVLIACDLWAIPAGLVDALAEVLHEHPETRHIGREHLIVGATHTHHSPGNYMSSRIYNRHASSLPGYDPDLHAFLLRRLTDAVRTAVAHKAPVAVRHGTRTVEGISRNRSIEPFLANPEAEAWMRDRDQAPRCGPDPAGPDPCHAVDPTLHVLVLSEPEAPEHIRGVAGFFAVHATTMPNDAELYHGDLFGIATARAASELATSEDAPVVALFNGAEGDVSPRWDEQGLHDTVALGRALGAELVAAAGEARTPVTGEVEASYRVEVLADREVTTAAGAQAHASRRAVSGRSQICGAEDGLTIFYELGIREGLTTDTPALAGQGAKLPVAPLPFVLLGLPTWAVPDRVPLNVARLGEVRIATLPGEFTTMLGHRIRDEIATRTGSDGPILLAGLAGEYLSYFTTPQEYALQHYEGASMVYGEDAGTVIQALLGASAESPGVSAPRRYRYEPGQVRRFGLGRDRVARRLTNGAAQRIDAQTGDTHGPTMGFEAAAVPWPPATTTGAAIPTVGVEIRAPGGEWTALADGTADIRTALVVVDVSNDRWRWEARLLEGAEATTLDPLLGGGREVRLHVVVPDGASLCSPALGPGAHEPGPCD